MIILYYYIFSNLNGLLNKSFVFHFETKSQKEKKERSEISLNGIFASKEPKGQTDKFFILIIWGITNEFLSYLHFTIFHNFFFKH